MADDLLPEDPTALRRRLHQNGWVPIPVKSVDHPEPKGAGKAPLLPGWQTTTVETLGPDRITAWSGRRHETNTGLVCGHLVVADIDVPVEDLADRLKATAIALLGPTAFVRIGRAPKMALCYRVASPIEKMLTPELFLPDGTKLQVEILGKGQQLVGYGLHPDTRRPYQWLDAAPYTHAFATVPEITRDALAAFIGAAEAILRAAGGQPARKSGSAAQGQRKTRPPREPKGTLATALDYPATTRADVEDALRAVPNTHDWHGWLKIGAAIHHAIGDAGEDLFIAWSAQSAKSDPEATKAKWASFRTSPMTDVSAATLFREARQNGWLPERERAAIQIGTHANASAPETLPIPNSVELTEAGIATAFVHQHRHDLRYCHDAGAWYVWSGQYWRRNRDDLAFAWARDLVHALNRDEDDAVKASTGRAAFTRSVERFARADRALAVLADAWDQDPWLLGTPDGTVDLRTGTLRPASRADMITRVTAIAPAARSACQRWRAFLEQATGGDKALIAFLQRWCGYCLTGSTREHALLFIFGPGGNGKSVFLNVVSGILSAYHATAAMDTFTESGGSRHLAFLAMLAGARMVTAAETEEGRPWAETKIKEMTGGTPVTANFMRQNPFTYVPAFKITITGNHKPALRNVDDAARRRFNIVPFIHRPEQPDRTLEEKLRQEWPAILRWMIDGCLMWQSEGLRRPQVVIDATADYFAGQDSFGLWKAERCILAPELVTQPSALLRDLNAWLSKNGEQPTNRNRFRAWAEKEPGLRYKTVKGSDLVAGIGLRPPEGGQGGDGWGR